MIGTDETMEMAKAKELLPIQSKSAYEKKSKEIMASNSLGPGNFIT